MSYQPLKGQTALVTGADVVVNYVSAAEAAERGSHRPGRRKSKETSEPNPRA